MNVDEMDYLSESLRARLEATRPAEAFLAKMLALTRSADELEIIGCLLVAEAWARRAEEQG